MKRVFTHTHTQWLYRISAILVLLFMFYLPNAMAQLGQFGVHNGTSITQFPIIKTTNAAFAPFVPVSFNNAFNIEIAKDYVYRRNRALIYGGNLCVSQDISSYGALLGKWSFKGAWYQTNYTNNPNTIFPVNIPLIITPGTNYLLDYHRWGNYDASFGLRERSTNQGFSNHFEGGPAPVPPSPDQHIKDAVITWSREFGQTPNRLIFQTMDRINVNDAGPYATINEHATILSNGNMGLGTNAPLAHLEIKPNAANPNANALNIINSSNNSGLLVNSIGNVGINNITPQEKLDVNGKIKVTGDILLNGENSYHTTRFQINQPSTYTSGQHLLKVTNGIDDFLNVYNGGLISNVSQFNVNSDNVYFNNSNTFQATGEITFRVPAPIGFPYDKAFDIQYQNSGNSLMYLQNDGQMYLKGSAYAYTPVTGIDNALFIDQYGKVYQDNILPLNKNNFWQVGGNQFNSGGGTQNLGTTNNNSIKFLANNTEAGTIIGNNSFKLGFLEYKKPAAFGGSSAVGSNAIATNDFAVTLLTTIPSYATGGIANGILNCINDFGQSALRVGNSQVGVFNHAFGPGFAIINTDLEVNGDVIPSSPLLNLGSSTDIWNQIWGTGGNISSSDKRLKTNIKSLNIGLETIKKLKPYSYNYKTNLETIHYGFIAQEIKDYFPNAIVAGTETDSTYLGVIYDEIVPILTKGIQEQQQMIDTLKQQISMLMVINKSKEKLEQGSQKEVLNQLPLLFQNHPNPFNGFTFIDYFLPPNANNAFIRVVDNNGKLVKAFPLNTKGYGQVELDCTNISAGTYYYTLLVDTQVIDTKSMIVIASN